MNAPATGKINLDKTCVLCGSSRRRVVFKEFEVPIFRCADCGHVYSSFENPQDYEGYFGSEIQQEEFQVYWDEAHKAVYDDFCARFLAGKKGRLLDVGCGLGYFVRAASRMPGWEAWGYEISPHAASFARDKLGLKNVRYGRVEDSDFKSESFDIITLWDVIEHIPDPKPQLGYLLELLKSGGFLFMHTPNVMIQLPKARLLKLWKGMDPDVHYLEARDHMNIYSMSPMRRLLIQVGYQRVKFIHLKPVRRMMTRENHPYDLFKNQWVRLAAIVYKVTLGKINVNNLFVVAYKV